MRILFGWYDENGEEIEYDNPFEFSEAELFWASLTVGAPSLTDAIQNILDSPAFALHKWYAVRSVVKIHGGESTLVPGYKNLDQSEKVVLSYWAGMIFAKLVGEKVLHVPWMAHARLLKKQKRLTVIPPTTKSLPDLVGLDRSEKWHILEAKGLQKRPSANQRINYKAQALRIGKVDGEKPASRNYCITNIRSPLSIELHDPDKIVKDSVEFNIDPIDFQQYYYKPFVEFFSKPDNTEDNDDYIIYKKVVCDTIDKRKCQIGIVRDILEQAKMQSEKKKADSKDLVIRSIEPKFLKSQGHESDEPDTYIGSDGIAVKLLPL